MPHGKILFQTWARRISIRYRRLVCAFTTFPNVFSKTLCMDELLTNVQRGGPDLHAAHQAVEADHPHQIPQKSVCHTSHHFSRCAVRFDDGSGDSREKMKFTTRTKMPIYKNIGGSILNCRSETRKRVIV